MVIYILTTRAGKKIMTSNCLEECYYSARFSDTEYSVLWEINSKQKKAILTKVFKYRKGLKLHVL